MINGNKKEFPFRKFPLVSTVVYTRLETPMERVNLLMSEVVLYKSVTIEHCVRKSRILYLASSFGESIEDKGYKLNRLN